MPLLLIAAATFAIAPTAAEAVAVHVACPNQSLQAKINAARPGDTLQITGTCVGSFTVAKPLTLQGTPHATLDGDQLGSTLTITTTKPVHLVNLTITRGLALHGGGINAQGGTLSLNHVVVQDNYAIADRAQGGGIYKKAGALTITASQIVHDVAFTKSNEPITDSQGGGIFMPAGKLTITGSTVAHDQSICHTPGQCQAIGGGIDYEGTTIKTTIASSHIDNNQAVATGNIAVAAGGGAQLLASFSITGSTLNGNDAEGTGNRADSQAVGVAAALAGAAPTAPSTISHTTIAGNRLTLDSTGSAATALVQGGAVAFGGPLTISSSHIIGNRVSVESNGEATADGGGLQVSSVTVTDSTISSNTITAHAGPSDATVSGGGLASGGGSVTFVRSTVSGNHLAATSAAGNATAAGGGITAAHGKFVLKSSTVSGNTSHAEASGATATAHAGGVRVITSSGNDLFVNSTIAANSATSTGSSAFAAGGGVEATDSTVTITDVTIAKNHSSERGGGLLAGGTTTATLEATILAGNTGPDGPDCRGTVGSAGHNLIGNDTNCTFTPHAGDKLNKTAKLGPLQNNGGPTQTIAVLTGSPALNAIPKAACAVTTDQRGIKRPQGSGCEIGAFELQP